MSDVPRVVLDADSDPEQGSPPPSPGGMTLIGTEEAQRHGPCFWYQKFGDGRAKKLNTSRACTRCRVRHVRCFITSQGAPCGNCRSRKETCDVLGQYYEHDETPTIVFVPMLPPPPVPPPSPRPGSPNPTPDVDMLDLSEGGELATLLEIIEPRLSPPTFRAADDIEPQIVKKAGRSSHHTSRRSGRTHKRSGRSTQGQSQDDQPAELFTIPDVQPPKLGRVRSIEEDGRPVTKRFCPSPNERSTRPIPQTRPPRSKRTKPPPPPINIVSPLAGRRPANDHFTSPSLFTPYTVSPVSSVFTTFPGSTEETRFPLWSAGARFTVSDERGLDRLHGSVPPSRPNLPRPYISALDHDLDRPHTGIPLERASGWRSTSDPVYQRERSFSRSFYCEPGFPATRSDLAVTDSEVELPQFDAEPTSASSSSTFSLHNPFYLSTSTSGDPPYLHNQEQNRLPEIVSVDRSQPRSLSTAQKLPPLSTLLDLLSFGATRSSGSDRRSWILPVSLGSGNPA